MILVGDTESDGLVKEATCIWCAVLEDIETKQVYTFDPTTIINLPDLLEEADEVVIHNLMGFDRLLIKKILGYLIPIEKCIDTLVLSRLLNPDRKVPKGWKGVPAPHSIEAWGMRCGISKPEHEDWSIFTSEMLYRCTKDKDIGVYVYREIMKEINHASR